MAPKSNLARTGATAIAMVVLVAGCNGATTSDSDPQLWPLGGVEDIEALAQRDDVNVLFIVVDTLRADRMGLYGYERDTTPTLESLARFGVRFDRHLAQSSWTKASMASMWTGFYPTRNGVIEFDDIIPEEAILPAEVFAANGFRTVGLYRNGWVAPTFGFGQGFENYARPSPLPRRKDVTEANPTVSLAGHDGDLVQFAIEFLRAERNQRFFLYLHLMDVHEYTFDEASALFGTSYSDIYDNSIRWTDDVLKVLFDQMIEWGLFRNTLVVLTSDHGEAFRERGEEGHARSLYRETTEIPFLLLFPFRLETGGLVVKSRTRNVDVWPTVYELLGLEVPTSAGPLDGVSLRDEILNAARRLPQPVEAKEREGFSHLSQNWGRGGRGDRTYALVEGTTRYVRKVEQGEVVEELFERTDDALELVDRSAEDPERLAAMRARAEALALESPVWGAPETRDLTELELNQLRALGYKVD
jgi:arylsulfatase A-like enzyme